MAISLSPPKQQADFARSLCELRSRCLQDALMRTVGGMDICRIDRELSSLVTPEDLQKLASRGLRGELLFATPVVLHENPRLLTYYRPLLGYSQKAFYNSGGNIGRIKCMEDAGKLPVTSEDVIGDLCMALVKAASYLLSNLPQGSITSAFLDDLSLLTLGPQMRGGTNVGIGTDSVIVVFATIQSILASHTVTLDEKTIELRNASSRAVLVEFASDPDITVRECIDPKRGEFRNVLAIEIKGGRDRSNIHNRLGEAEKSHLSAKQNGFVECWTIINVELAKAKAKANSPTTDRFFSLASIRERKGEEFEQFATRLCALTGIPRD